MMWVRKKRGVRASQMEKRWRESRGTKRARLLLLGHGWSQLRSQKLCLRPRLPWYRKFRGLCTVNVADTCFHRSIRFAPTTRVGDSGSGRKNLFYAAPDRARVTYSIGSCFSQSTVCTWRTSPGSPLNSEYAGVCTQRSQLGSYSIASKNNRFDQTVLTNIQQFVRVLHER